MLQLLRHEAKLLPIKCTMERMKASLSATAAYPDIKSATEVHRRRALIQDSIRSLQTAGVVGSALAAMLPFSGSWKFTIGMRLCAPIIAMTIAETHLSTYAEDATTKGSTTQNSITYEYVVSLYQVVTDPESDLSISSKNLHNVLEVLSSIGAPENQKRKTLQVDHIAGNFIFPVGSNLLFKEFFLTLTIALGRRLLVASVLNLFRAVALANLVCLSWWSCIQ